MECTPSAPMRRVPVQAVWSEKWAVIVVGVGWVMEIRVLDHWGEVSGSYDARIEAP